MSNIIDSILQLLFGSHPENTNAIPAEKKVFSGEYNKLEEEIQKAFNDPPRIAIIGKAGVGKSSTINALFNPVSKARIGHVKATTKKIKEYKIPLGRSRGSIIVVDCPGLGESIKADLQNIPQYIELLAKCDIALWVLKADERALAEDQRFLSEILPIELKKRLVVGINQIDLIQPGHWVEEYNLPSIEQEQSITQKIKEVQKKLKEVNIRPRAIVAYSALKHYHLVQLFRAMLEAYPQERAWVLSSRKDIAPYKSPQFDTARNG